MLKEFIIVALIIEDDRPAHIARHGVTIDEVLEVFDVDFVYQPSKEHPGRWLLTLRTTAGRFLTVVVGERAELGVYGLVTARPARDVEKQQYAANIDEEGGEDDDTHQASA